MADELAVVGAHRNHFRGGGVVDLRAVGAGPRVLLRGRLRQRLERLLLLAVAASFLIASVLSAMEYSLACIVHGRNAPRTEEFGASRGPVNVTRPPAH